jgi:hypothetical protein
VVALGREVATAATVWSRRGVDAYVMVSPSNATLVNGRTATDDAPGKEILSAAAAEGFRDERLNSPGARTLEFVSMHSVAQGEFDLRINHMSNTVEQDGVGEGNSRVVDPCGTVWQDSECQISPLERRHSNIAQRRRENDTVRDDVEFEDFLECRKVGRLKN